MLDRCPRCGLELRGAIGAILRRLRLRYLLTHADAARRIGVAQCTWSRWEAGRWTPHLPLDEIIERLRPTAPPPPPRGNEEHRHD